MADSDRKKVRELEEKFFNIKMSYYRFVIRNEDKNILSKFAKIPDNWDTYIPAQGVNINDSVKSRLSDIKIKKSWELKLESLYLFYITDIENKITLAFQQRDLSDQEIDEAIDSINCLMLELDDDLLNFKYLMLTLAKRSISDFYYILSSYSRFFHKKNLNFESDVKLILKEFIAVLKGHRELARNIDKFIEYNSEIEPLFQKSSNQLGWRMNEFAVKEYLDSQNSFVKIIELNKAVKEAYDYKRLIMTFYSFLKYYYNENDGKLFRLNFISDSLKAKMADGKISAELFESYEEIRNSFVEYKLYFETIGLAGFGPDRISYYELLDFIYRGCKIIEFYYLRNMKHDLLNRLRTDILYYIEKEIISMNE